MFPTEPGQWLTPPAVAAGLAVCLVSLVWVRLCQWTFDVWCQGGQGADRTGPGRQTDDGTSIDRAGGPTVTCPDCGTTNEAGYRYCRACVRKLPRSMTSYETPPGPLNWPLG